MRLANSQRGFTLIELIATVAIIGIVTAAVATGVNNIRGASVQAEAGKIAGAVRYLYNLAVVSGRNHRLVIDFDSKSWWAEGQTSDDPCEAFLLPGKDDDLGNKDADGKVVNSGGFEITKSTLLQKTDLDKGIHFAGVITSHQTQVADKGQAFIYFFPNGTTENAYVQLEGDPDDTVTVEVVAMQGLAILHNENMDLNDVSRRLDKEND